MDHEPVTNLLQCFVFAELACGSSCDEYSINGQLKPEFEERASYGYAQKMRAAATYLYARLLQLGSVPWHKSELTGKMVGNPSISEVVSTYMLSLRRRKVRLSLQNSHVFPLIISWELGSKGGGPYKCTCNHTCRHHY